jgi:hypothetical protein
MRVMLRVRRIRALRRWIAWAALVSVAMLDDVALYGRRPLALVVDLSVEADGGDDGAGGGADGFGLLDEVFEGGAEGGAALGAEAGGVGVAVDDGLMGDSVLAGDFLGAEPAEVVLVDEFAVLVMANRAFAGVSGAVGATCALLDIFGWGICALRKLWVILRQLRIRQSI